MQQQKFVSVKAKVAKELLKSEDYCTTVQKRGRHWFVNTDAPLPRVHRAFYDAKGRLVDNGPEAEFCITMEYMGESLVSLDSQFVS
jgi:hypothetical protein